MVIGIQAQIIQTQWRCN